MPAFGRAGRGLVLASDRLRLRLRVTLLGVALLRIGLLAIGLLRIGRRRREQAASAALVICLGRRLLISLLGVLRLRVRLLHHHRHRLAGRRIDHISLLLARAGSGRERGHHGEQNSDFPH